MYKIIFSDIDRTLSIKKAISKENVDAIKKWVSKDKLFVLVTGRVIPYASSFAEEIGASNYVICNNGSIVYDWLSKKIIYEEKINKDVLDKMFEITNNYNARYIIGGIDATYTNKIKYDYETKIDEITNEIYLKNPITQITISHDNKDVMLNIINEINSLNDIIILNRHRSLYDTKFNDGGSIWIDIASINISKGKAINKLLKHLNIDLKDTIRIGDDLNDLPMFLNKGLNVAVENAVDELKNKADYITDSCLENGVAKLIDKIINNDI